MALLLPPPVAAEVDGLRRALGDGALGRIPAHLTLVPPVNVRHDRLGEALAVLREAADATRPFSVVLGPPGTFMPHSPVVYLPVGGDAAVVHALRERAFRPPLARPLTWPFVPHVTVADDAAPHRIEAALAALDRYVVSVGFDRVHLLQESSGRVWEPIADAPFAPAAVVGRGGLPLELSVSERLDPEAAAFAGAQGCPPHRPFAVTARREGRVVATASGHTSGPTAHLDRLVVDAAERRQGIGSHVLAAAESLAAERGCRSITAHAPPGTPAESFYRSRGWAEAEDVAVLRRDL